MKKSFLILLLAASLIFATPNAFQQQSILNPIAGAAASGGGGGGSASSFAYVTGSATGCGLEQSIGTQQCPFALHQTPGAGHLLVLFATWLDPGTTNVTVSDPNNGTWTAIGSKVAGSGGSIAGFSSQLFMVTSAVSSPTTITAVLSTAQTDLWWEAAEYSYTGTLSGVDGTQILSNLTASGSVATQSGLTTTGSSDLIWAVCANVDSQCTVGSGFTLRDDAASCIQWNGTSCASTGSFIGHVGLGFEDEVNVAAGPQTATFGTGGATDHMVFGLVGF